MAFLPWGKRRETLRRAEDILAQCARDLELGEKKFTSSGRDWVARREWDTGSNEMRRLIYHAALTSPCAEVDSAHFPPRMRKDHEAFGRTQFENLALEEVVRQKISHFFARLGEIEVTGIHGTVIRQIEKPLIEKCLEWAGFNQLKASRVLGVNRNTLRKKIKELKIKNEK